ncbi:LptA/OstA family protein [Helicobacter sp. MIT 14-3879]|uniref:LptA/OstA family protein n=1 Tax=Helicobacter sp. MIT 14-3879 TaxID=2040649 RepID=UPI000E1F261D|nr:LptA/OstA family protein [Helicobacter sp. MIT 14-3879]RDU64721.1 lipopolysaccharide transport periplasmic protein LptA [Helicobacter sp. MIT 14-3879]
MKTLLLLIMLFTLNASDDILEVSALNFLSDEKKGIVELNTNVEIKKGKDELYAPKVIINIDKNRKPIKYSAYGGVDFLVVTKDNRHLKGSADEVYYNTLNGEYKLVGNGKVKEDNKINLVVGEEIIINNDIGYVNITGTDNKPAKVIFQMEKKDDKK